MTHATVMFLHGASLGAWMWQEIIDYLPEFNCLAPTLPEHGNQATLFSLESSLNHLKQYVSNHEKKVYIVGVSLGALVGLEFTRQHPDLVETMLLSSTSLGPLPGGHLLTHMSRPIAWVSKRSFAIQQAAKQLRIPEEMYAEFEADMQQMSSALFKRVNETIHNYRVSEKSLDIQQATLIVCGGREAKFIRENQLILAKHLHNAEAYSVPDVGHGWCFEKPKLFAETVRAWVQQSDLPSQLKRLV